ncbi:MAG TPA: DsbA family protein [Candidatus Binataceae bacterium]|jgi:predicted DsbA family dithiol-disulfide isomerase|nr:DsbA family protein [Candidatus Binataceae bacterium]
MEQPVIPIYFDYASTLCYVAWRIVVELERELGFAALWKGVPIALRNYRARPGQPLGALERARIQNVAAETAVAVEPPARWLDSQPALQGAEFAREAGAFRAYHDAVFRAAFEERADIGALDVLCAIAARAGLDPVRFRDALERGAMAERIAENKREADRFSALGYPTFVLGDFPLIGIQPIETMRMVLGRFLARRAAEPRA